MKDKNRVEFVIFDVCKCKTQNEFAKMLGVSRQRVTNWKRRGNFPVGLIPYLCEKTGMPPFIFNERIKPSDRFQW